MALTTAFARNGNRKAVPQTTADGSVSYDQGFGNLYALPPEEGGLFIDRAQFNQIMYDTTSAVISNQSSINTLNSKVTANTNSINTLNQKVADIESGVTSGVVNLTTNQTIAGVKTFSSPPVSATNPTNNNQVANKAYVDSVGNAKVATTTYNADKATFATKTELNTKANANATVNLTGNQTIAGVKTFSAPVVVPNATANTHAVNLAQLNTKANQATTYTKTEVDTRVNAKANANAVVALTGNQTIAGVKTFSSPVVVPNATDNTHAVNLAQLNTKANQAATYTKTEVNNLVNAKANANATVNLTGNQTVAGVKTFSAVPVVASQPTNANQVANKAYVDSKLGKAYITQTYSNGKSWYRVWSDGFCEQGSASAIDSGRYNYANINLLKAFRTTDYTINVTIGNTLLSEYYVAPLNLSTFRFYSDISFSVYIFWTARGYIQSK